MSEHEYDRYNPAEACCYGKEAFVSVKLAKAVAKHRSRRGRKGEAYACPNCRLWHIGRRNPLKRVTKGTEPSRKKWKRGRAAEPRNGR